MSTRTVKPTQENPPLLTKPIVLDKTHISAYFEIIIELEPNVSYDQTTIIKLATNTTKALFKHNPDYKEDVGNILNIEYEYGTVQVYHFILNVKRSLATNKCSQEQFTTIFYLPVVIVQASLFIEKVLEYRLYAGKTYQNKHSAIEDFKNVNMKLIIEGYLQIFVKCLKKID